MAPLTTFLKSLMVPLDGLPLMAQLRTPLRASRIIALAGEQAHSVRYPPSYSPRDNLAVTDEMLDWTGDHIHTNYRDLFIWLREQGYYVETLGCAFTCFNATEYGALLLVDSEAEYGALEVIAPHLPPNRPSNAAHSPRVHMVDHGWAAPLSHDLFHTEANYSPNRP